MNPYLNETELRKVFNENKILDVYEKHFQGNEQINNF